MTRRRDIVFDIILAIVMFALAIVLAVSLQSRGSETGPVVTPAPSATAPFACHYRTAANGQALPDPACTPGATDPRVTQDNISQTICHAGYTATVRPPVSFTEPLKRRDLVLYGQDVSHISEFELDHLVPLELGGAPSDPANLWVEPGATPNPKDSIENRLRRAVCEGTISLAEAQRRIASDWTTALP